MSKLPAGVFPPEAMSSCEEIALQFQNHHIRGRANLRVAFTSRRGPKMARVAIFRVFRCMMGRLQRWWMAWWQTTPLPEAKAVRVCFGHDVYFGCAPPINMSCRVYSIGYTLLKDTVI